MNKFACNNCVFKITEENTQTGCGINRLDKLLGREFKTDDLMEWGDEQVACYDKFCMTFRPPVWLDCISGDPKEEVFKELKIVVGYVIAFEEDLASLEATLNSIVNPSYVIVTNSKPEYNEGIFQMLEDKFPNVLYSLVQFFEDYFFDVKLDKVFKHCKTGWVLLIKAGDTIPKNFNEVIFNRVYNEIKRLGVCFNENRDRLLVQASIFNYLGGNMPVMKEDGSVDNRNFYERLADTEITDSDIIVKWEDLFNE